MSSKDIAIKVENLSKRYRIGLKEEMHENFIGAIFSFIKSPLKNYRKYRSLYRFDDIKSEPDNNQQNNSNDIIWALREISFQVKRGEVVGIIGRNGSGKSTLLKILSKITDPTNGCAEIRGRVSSLLEVGTGFSPELTGRENVYLNGIILGMRKKEVDSKFDKIVDFSGIAKFIDTPVKRYSSGMTVRLAFSVAAHLEPEILLVDEVLAVGDVDFQKKCLGKMADVVREGRTILFVSHNMAAIQNLCSRSILLNNGSIEVDDSSINTIAHYLRTVEAKSTKNLNDRIDRTGIGDVRVTRLEILGGDNYNSTTLSTGKPARFVFCLNSIKRGVSCIFTIYNQLGLPIANFNSGFQGPEDSKDPEIGSKLICEFKELFLVPGRYRINVAIMSDDGFQDHLEGAAVFDVVQGSLRGRPVVTKNEYGSALMPHLWILPI